MEDKGVQPTEDLGCCGKEILASREISTGATKRKLMVLVGYAIKHGHDSSKDVSGVLRVLYIISASGNRTVKIPKCPRKRKPKWSAKEVPLFNGGPKKWVQWVKSVEASIG